MKPYGSKNQGKGQDRFREKTREPKIYKQPQPMIQTTTLWDFPSQHYGEDTQGDGEYAGVTPSYIIWNLLQRYTKPGDTVLDPMCGSGTTLDVCKDLGRVGIGFDLQPKHPEAKKADARKLPLPPNSVDFVFVDPPYSNHIKYSGDERCIGELDAREGNYYEAMEGVIAGLYKNLKDGGYLALYIQDSFAKGKDFAPLGFEMFLRLAALMDPVDIISVVRHNKTLKRNHWHTSAIEGNFYLRGFNYLFVMRKNVGREAGFLKHESSSSLSRYFKEAALGRPAEVITPEKLAEIIKSEQKELDQKLFKKPDQPKKPIPQKKSERSSKKPSSFSSKQRPGDRDARRFNK